MDIVFQDFIRQEYDQLNEQEKLDLDALLNEADLDILNWLMGKDEPTTEAFKHLVHRIRVSRQPG